MSSKFLEKILYQEAHDVRKIDFLFSEPEFSILISDCPEIYNFKFDVISDSFDSERLNFYKKVRARKLIVIDHSDLNVYKTQTFRHLMFNGLNWGFRVIVVNPPDLPPAIRSQFKD